MWGYEWCLSVLKPALIRVMVLPGLDQTLFLWSAIKDGHFITSRDREHCPLQGWGISFSLCQGNRTTGMRDLWWEWDLTSYRRSQGSEGQRGSWRIRGLTNKPAWEVKHIPPPTSIKGEKEATGSCSLCRFSAKHLEVVWGCCWPVERKRWTCGGGKLEWAGFCWATLCASVPISNHVDLQRVMVAAHWPELAQSMS